jgi:nitric oxide reductase NorD protein
MYPDDLESDGGDHLAGKDLEGAEKNAISYREWDYTRQRYREGFCLLNEFDVPTGEEGFVEDTLAKYQGLLKSIKKTFEAVLGEAKLQRKQSQGDDIDIDALVEAHADFASGLEMSDYVYTRYRNLDRNIAVMFMVDMSGSTLGWVNDAERESLILLCEALETLGDRYAIYGFSGRTNKRCEIYRVKRFDESYTGVVRARISGIRPKSYTRMGVAIRHLGHLLNMTRARTKILITLSDGRPEDYGGYKGRYGIEDTRHALLELRRDGVHSFCITIDKEAQDYLPHMYGVANYAVIDEVKKLPLKVADIYRRLTT